MTLPSLTSFSLRYVSALAGLIPPARCYPKLQSLTMNVVGLGGSIPVLPSGLQSLSITNVQTLGGTLDALASSGFTSLQTLSISGTGINGTIPVALVPALNNLTSCGLTGNSIQCPLPAGLTKLACNPNSCH